MRNLITIVGLIISLAAPSISHAGRGHKRKNRTTTATATTTAIASASDLVFEKLFSDLKAGHSVAVSCDGGESGLRVMATLNEITSSISFNIHIRADIYEKSDGSKVAAADFVNPYFWAGQLAEHNGDSMILGLNIGNEGNFVGGALSVYESNNIQFSYQWLYDTAPIQITNCSLNTL